MSYLSLSNPTTDSCDFRVKLSNDFNTDYYRELRITGRDYGSSTDRVSSYVESRTASSSYSSRYVEGVVNDGMSAGRTYTLYAYAQAQNGTWYKAGSDTITMQDSGGSSEFDLGIRDILYKYSDTSDDYEEVEDGMNFEVGREIEFKLPVKNYDNSEGPRYTVVVYNQDGNRLDSDSESTLDGRETNNAYLSVTINNPGQQRLKFAIETDGGHDTDDDDNVEYRTVRFSGGSASIAKEISDGVINNEYMSSGSKGQWFKVRFNKDGLANFWINSAGLSNDLDLYIYETQDTGSNKLGSSTNSPGSDKADDIVRDIPVTAEKEYYIYVKNYGGNSCSYQIKAKLYPPTAKQLSDGVINNEYMSSGSKGQWFKVRFNKDGLANFWINSAGLSNDLDLYIYEAQDTEGIKLGSSTNSPGSDKADDIVRDIPVTAGKEYYIYVKNYGGKSCSYQIKVKNYQPSIAIPSAPITEEVYEGGFKARWGSVASATKYKLKVRREYDSHTTYYETSDTNYSIPSGSLQYGVTHLVSVQAGNNYGWSNYSSENKLTTRAKHPTLKVIKKTSDSIKVNISGLLSNNNGVRVELCNSNGTPITTKTTGTNGGNIVFDNLTNDTTYIIKAKTLFSISGANRDSDYVELSAKTDKIPLPSIPSAPRTEEVYEGGFKVRWGSVVSATKYRLRVRKEGDSETKDYETSNTNYSIPSGSLQYGVTYLVSVQAGNNQGWSDYSNENPLTTRAKHPTLKVIEKTSDSIKVNISGLSGNKDGVEVYLYDHRGIYVKRKTIDIIEEDIDIFDEEDIDILDEENIDTNGGNIVFDNLTSDTYIIKAKTLFSISGANRDSDYVELSVEIDNVPLPSIPSAPRTEEVYEGGFKVSWGSVASATRYRLKVRREYDSHTTYYETSDTNYSIPSGSLQYGVTHLVSVQAGNNQGWSDYSNENPLTTRAKHPTLKVIEKTSDSIKVNISGLLSNNNGVRVDLYNPKGELERTKITEKDGGNIVFIGLRGDTQYTIKAKTLFNISGVDRGSDYVELLEKTDIAPVGILKEIEDNTVYNEIMNTSEEGKWYKVKFDRNGKANFWINSAGLTNNLDLFIHAHQDLDSTKLGESIQYPGNNQADDMVLDLDVRAGVYYYIYVKNCDGGSCDFKIKTRLQAKEIQDDTVYNESINASEEGKWYRVRFDRDGKANFWINSAGLDNNLDLFIYENQDLDSSKLGESTQSDNQADDMVLNLDVRAGVYYYVYIKNCGGGSCDFKIKSKIQAKEIQNGTVYDENMSSHDKGKWYKIKFAQNGKANFWINSRELDNNLDLFIYENQDLKSTKLGESEQSDNQADDMVLDLDVRAGVYYYVYIKNQGSGSCNFKIKAKLQEEDPSWSGGDIIPPKYYVNQGLYTDIMLGSSGKSVKNAGCYISSIATIICWYLKDDRADTKEALIRQMASKCNSGGGYSNADVKYNGRTFRIDRNSDMEEKILEGLPAICEMPHHFVVVNGYDANKSGYKRFSVLDPGDRNAKTLYDSMNKSNHGFSVKSERFVYEVGGSKPPTGGKPTPGGNMDVSEKYIDFVKDYETFQEKPYRGSDKQNLTIGYGHVIKPGEHFGIMTKPEAVELLKKDLKVRIDYVNRKIKEDNLTLNQHQFDALVDFRYNKGAALSTEPGVCTLYRLIAKEKVMSGEKLMNAFLMWCKVGDEFNKGVYRRSYDEGEMFIKGDYTRNYPEKP